jgi:hypothetical protein
MWLHEGKDQTVQAHGVSRTGNLKNSRVRPASESASTSRRELGLEGGAFGEVQPEGEDLGRPTPPAAPPAPTFVSSDKRFTRLVKQLEAQGNPDAEEVARKRLGM